MILLWLVVVEMQQKQSYGPSSLFIRVSRPNALNHVKVKISKVKTWEDYR